MDEHHGNMGEPRGRAGPEPWEVPPWELPGNVRRDCEPHRADLLGPLGMAAEVCGAVSLVCSPWFAPMLLAGPVGVVLGVTAWALARRDLARMRAGLIDPAGLQATEKARAWGRAGATLAFTSFLMWAAVLVLLG